MTQPDLEQIVEELLTKVRETLLKKGQDYSNQDRLSNFKQSAYLTGTTADQVCQVLMSVKLSRLTNLRDVGVANFESVEDTALDLVVYSILNYVILKDAK